VNHQRELYCLPRYSFGDNLKRRKKPQEIANDEEENSAHESSAGDESSWH